MSFKQIQTKTNSLPAGIMELLSETLNQEQLKTFDVGSNLSESQNKAFESFKKGDSLLVLGSAGCGKSMLIKTIQEYNNSLQTPKNMYLTATTGVSSYAIAGCTIHSFLGIGTGEKDIGFLVRRVLRNKALVERLRQTDILVIDEISMLSGSLFEKINVICQHFRKNKLFMGGIQIIFTGDIMQLSPVFNQNSEIFTEPEDTRLIIESDQFNKKFNKKNNNIIILTKNFRQLNDTFFTNLLLRIRLCNQTENDIELLKNKCNNFSNELKVLQKKQIIPVYLVTSNKKAQIINDTNLKKIKSKEFKYTVHFNTVGESKDCIDILKRELDSQLKQKGLIGLSLKIDARVMLIKNLDVVLGLVNGAIGTIIDINDNGVTVLFDNGVTRQIVKEIWELEMNDNTVTATQIPLMLAYSITTHKAQSLTIEYAVMDLADVFCDHQIYTSLSRVKTWDGLLLKSFDENKIKINQKMKVFTEEHEN